MATNQIKPFATGPGANIVSQNEWETLPALLSGFTAGKASSAQINKVLRQTSFIAAALAEFVSEKSGQDVLDDGDVAGFVAKLSSGIAANYLSREKPFADIKADGAAAVSTALANLGLGEGSALPVGVPVPWPSATPPTGWLKCNGAAFTASQYPKLALAYPALRLPDLRGEFIRGWDDGRGIDSGRSLLSSQKATLMESFGLVRSSASGIYRLVTRPVDTVTNDSANYMTADYDAREGLYGATMGYPSSDLTPSGSSSGVGFRVRPRNVAFNYIVRAA